MNPLDWEDERQPMDAATTASQPRSERARKIESALLRSLASVGQVAAARHLGVSEPAISRWKEEQLPRLCELIAFLGKKIVDEDAVCMPPDELDALTTLASRYFKGRQ